MSSANPSLFSLSNSYTYNNFEIPSDETLPFFGNLEAKKADRILKICEAGTYLVRFSSTIKDVVNIVFSAKTLENELIHYSYIKTEQGYFVCNKKKEGYSLGKKCYPDLQAIIHHRRNDLTNPLPKTAEFDFHPANWSLVPLDEVKLLLQDSSPKSFLFYEMPGNEEVDVFRYVYYKNSQDQLATKEIRLCKGVWVDKFNQAYLDMDHFLKEHEEVFNKPILFTHMPTWQNSSEDEISQFVKHNHFVVKKQKEESLKNQDNKEEVVLYRSGGIDKIIKTTLNINQDLTFQIKKLDPSQIKKIDSKQDDHVYPSLRILLASITNDLVPLNSYHIIKDRM